jgi:hypothetical protein
MDKSQHIHQIWWGDGAWHHVDLTTLTGADPAQQGSGLTSHRFSAANGQQVIGFISNRDHVCQFYYADRWQKQDLSEIRNPGSDAAPPNAATRSSLTSYDHANARQQAFVYQDVYGHIYQFYWDQRWYHTDLTTATDTGMTLPAGASSLTSHCFTGQQVIGYVNRTQDGATNLNQLYYTNEWRFEVLAKTLQPAAGEGLTSYVSEPVHAFACLDTKGHVYQIWWDGASWKNQDLTALCGATLAPLDAAMTSYSQPVQSIVYVGTDNHLHQFWYDGSWHYADLNTSVV